MTTSITASYSNLPAVLELGAFVYVQVDSWGDSPTFGAVNELDEFLGDLTVPETPTPAPTPAPTPQNLASIVLNAGNVYEGAWTVVQRQGGDGGAWHDVGWRGSVVGGQVRWRVAEKDFRTGPLRWLIYDASGNEGRATNSSFTLPDSPS